ncbi:unnamed protein product [Owenia fusiformis]|uniref:Uncharacterized protein n=1 Tax=Owenia fusiformis TaxID=6347 RepID=A0A8J1TZ62_OWEFU|nr:unnamed protein product [Owenia fusiformis]
MGINLSFMSCFHKRDLKILITGLDAAGKTTLLYRLHTHQLISTIPTIGWNVEDIEYRSVRMQVIETGGSEKLRPLICHYWPGVDAVIFVADSIDKDTSRISELKAYIMHHNDAQELWDKPFLIIANKQDLPNAMSMEEMTTRLDLNRLQPGHKWYIAPVSCVTGEGLGAAMDWLLITLGRIKQSETITQPINNAFVDMNDTFPLDVDDKGQQKWRYILRGWNRLKNVFP